MPPLRSYIPAARESLRASLVLDPDESHHLVTVRRARVNEEIAVFNGRGSEWLCRLEKADPQGVHLSIISHRQLPELSHAISLVQAVPKRKAWHTLITRATELGVSCIVPVLTDNAENRPSAADMEAKQRKWRTLAIEAAKQSQQSFIPEILDIQSFKAFMAQVPTEALKLVASLEPNALNLRDIYLDWAQKQSDSAQAKAIYCLIGPEGDLTAEEYALARRAGFQAITLGQSTLKVETAAIAALSILHYELRLNAVSPC